MRAMFIMAIALRCMLAQGQMIDMGFGVNGFAPAPNVYMYTQPTAMAFGADGSIVVAGPYHPGAGYMKQWFVYRYLANGTPDPAFSSDGCMLLNPCVSDDYVTEVWIDDLGRTFVSGYESWNPLGYQPPDVAVMARISYNGVQDLTFGEAGFSHLQHGGLNGDTRTVVTVPRPDGGFLVSCNNIIGGSAATTFRLTESGLLDTINGVLTYSDPDGWNEVLEGTGTRTIDGGACMLGFSRMGQAWAPPYKLTVLKIDSLGMPDTSFGNNGWFQENLGNHEGKKAVCDVQGRLLVLGRSSGSGTGTSTALLVRLLPDGTMDQSFGINGMMSFDLHEISDFDIAVDGRIALLNSTGGISMRDDAGMVISSFGVDGMFQIPAAYMATTTSFIKFTPDGNALMYSGMSGSSHPYDILLVRIIADISTSLPHAPSQDLSVFPNPARDHVVIGPISGRVKQLELYDACGRVVMSRSYAGISGALDLELDEQWAGSYILRVINEHGVAYTRALMIE